jgi:hypothetical protein
MFIVWSVVNSIAWYYHSTQALSVGVVMQLFFLWLLGMRPIPQPDTSKDCSD